MTANPRTREILQHLASRPGHDEVKADFRALLTEEFGADIRSMDFEQRVPEVRGRIDALIGRTVFEAKSNLEREWSDVERRLPDYLADRERDENERFVGIASDGLRWAVFELRDGALEKLKETELDPDKAEPFLAWLDGALALKSSLPPEALTIRFELGGDSVAFRRASQELLAIWNASRDQPAAALKKQLWASMLKLVYGREIDNDLLWIQHTYLVVVAKSIALAVLDLADDDPARMLSGSAFEQANIRGAVESDFFDWVVATPDGEKLVRRIMAHVRRFRLREVETDVLKILYESLIDRDERHGLGEYYTPDWLAAKVVNKAVDRPDQQKILDPACGSGAFLFHAIRSFLAEAEEIDYPEDNRAAEATRLVTGMDIHPVAVIIARVTYLLALAPALGVRKGDITIPVYLGEAMQLSITRMLTDTELRVRIPSPGGDADIIQRNGHGGEHLDFPEVFCRNPEMFDFAIYAMRRAAREGWTREQYETNIRTAAWKFFDTLTNMDDRWENPRTKEWARGVAMLGETYLKLDRLEKEGRDTIWTYVARNLSRPLFLSARNGWANVVVGNPPWVAYRHMSADLQTRFKELARAERVYVGGRLTTQNDLCALFTVRAASLYLRPGGRLAFVLPLAALTRGQFGKFRSGIFDSVRLRFDETWTMDDGVQPLFPVPSCVVFTTRRRVGQQMHDRIGRRAYSGLLPYRDAPEDIADARLKVDDNPGDPAEATFAGGSPYRGAFRQGATLVPRFLCFVERKKLGRLGADASRPAIVSRRSPQEKEPWKSQPSIEGNIESGFLRPVLLGESILPYRVFRSFEAVVPVTGNGEVLSSTLAANRGHDGLANWMRQAEEIWEANKAEGTKIDLSGQLDYYGKLAAQFPAAPLRITYAASGTIPAACIVEDGRFVFEHQLYWAAISARGEAQYLSTIINSEKTRSLIAHLQSRGQWGARHFDKVMFNLPIPRFEDGNALHQDLSAAGAEAEKIAASVELPEDIKFRRARGMVRDALAADGIAETIDGLVARLLGVD